MTEKILLVEDEELVGIMVRLNLQAAGYQVRWERAGTGVAALCAMEPFDLILLDISLPEVDGLQVLRALRSNGVGTPVMMLTATSDVSTKVRALSSGADDYLPKPFDLAELLARVGALVRRSRADREIPSNRLLRFGVCEINLQTGRARSPSSEHALSVEQIKLVKLIIRTQGRLLTSDDIRLELFGSDSTLSGEAIDGLVNELRTIVQSGPGETAGLVTVPGQGYLYRP